MDKIDAFYELEKRYDNLQLNYDFSIKINGHFKIILISIMSQIMKCLLRWYLIKMIH